MLLQASAISGAPDRTPYPAHESRRTVFPPPREKNVTVASVPLLRWVITGLSGPHSEPGEPGPGSTVLHLQVANTLIQGVR